MKVLVAERIAEEGINILQGFAEVDIKISISRKEILDIIEDYHAIIVRSVTKVDKELIEKAKNLKVIGRAGTGIDNVDVREATRRGIVVVNSPQGNSNAAAELAIGLIFSVCRNIPQAYMSVKNEDFRRNRFKGTELNGKTVGVVGLGRIGSIVASRIKCFDTRVIAYDPYISDDRYRKMGVEKCSDLDELLQQADIITLHMPKLNDTVNMIGEREIDLMKKGVRIINCARGGLIDEEALYKAIKDGKVAAAGLDVLEREPNYEAKPGEQEFSHPLLELDNVIFTPHLGASTFEAQYNVGVMIAEQTVSALKGEIVSAVNMPSLHVKDLGEIKRYLDLAEKMGKIYFQTEKHPVEKIEIFYSGKVSEQETKVTTLAFLKGFLEPIMSGENVNYVNAEMLVRARGIEVVESKSSHSERFTSLITATVTTKERKLTISGTVFGNDEMRLVDFFGYNVDFEPTTPFALAVQNIDQPGIIGQIGTILGIARVNIASMRLSRNKKGEKAVAFLGVDSEVSENVLQHIRNVDGILKATMIKF